MALFNSHRDAASEPDDVISLLWEHEVSEDGGKNWRPEIGREGADPDMLRRGTWVLPPTN